MLKTEAEFMLEERPNRFAPQGKEWALYVRMLSTYTKTVERWTVTTWDEALSTDVVEATKETVLRAFSIMVHTCDVYARNTRIY